MDLEGSAIGKEQVLKVDSIMSAYFYRTNSMELTKKRVIDAELQGRLVSQKEALRLENIIAENEWDIETRIKLVSFYKANPASSRVPGKPSLFYDHVHWIISNIPESPAAGCNSLLVDKISLPQEYENLKSLWWQQAELNPHEKSIHSNAAKFFSLNDPLDAIRILERAIAEEAFEAELLLQICKHYCSAAQLTKDSFNQEYVERCLDAYRVYKITSNKQCAMTEIRIAELLFEVEEIQASKEFGNSALKCLDENLDSSTYRHRAYTLLGLIALKEGDLKLALSHLKLSSSVNTSPVLSSFGPSMKLANALLLRKQRLAVIMYLLSCRRVWKKAGFTLYLWVFQILLGIHPCFECST